MGVKDVTGNDVRGDELSQVPQQRLIARRNHGVEVAACGLLMLIAPALSNWLFEARGFECTGALILIAPISRDRPL